MEDNKTTTPDLNESKPTEPTTPPVTPMSTSTPAAATTAAGVNGPFPHELAGWNWGAFFLSWIWAIGNSVWIGLLALAGFIPVFGWIIALVTAIVLGAKGNEWAWKYRHFDSIDQFKSVQKAWAIWGLVLVIIGFVFSFVFSAVVLSVLFHVKK